MKNKLSVLRMIEIEDNLEKNNSAIALNDLEADYIKRAIKLPLKYIVEIVNIMNNNKLFISELDIKKTIINMFPCSYEELNNRLKDVYLIIKYKNKILDNMVNDQKRMVKTIKNMS